MKIKSFHLFFLLIVTGVMINACSTQKVASVVKDDVYFNEETANKAVIVATNYQPLKSDVYQNQKIDRNNDPYFENEYRSGFDNFYFRNNFTWRDYYYRNNLVYDPFFGSNYYSGFNNGWSLSIYGGNPFVFNQYGYYNNFNINPWNNYYQNGFYNYNPWNGYYYGNSPYGGIYSYYQPGYYGNYGGHNHYYNDQGTYSTPKSPRPRGSSDNTRSSNPRGSTITYPTPTTRPIRNDAVNMGGGNAVQDNRNQSGSGSNNTNARPTRTKTSGQDNNTTQPTNAPTQNRPTRTETPNTPPPAQSSDTGRSSGSSSNSSGSTSSPRPTRTGGGK